MRDGLWDVTQQLEQNRADVCTHFREAGPEEERTKEVVATAEWKDE